MPVKSIRKDYKAKQKKKMELKKRFVRRYRDSSEKKVRPKLPEKKISRDLGYKKSEEYSKMETEIEAMKRNMADIRKKHSLEKKLAQLGIPLSAMSKPLPPLPVKTVPVTEPVVVVPQEPVVEVKKELPAYVPPTPYNPHGIVPVIRRQLPGGPAYVEPTPYPGVPIVKRVQEPVPIVVQEPQVQTPVPIVVQEQQVQAPVLVQEPEVNIPLPDPIYTPVRRVPIA